jgi:hypothetical protein
MRWVAAGTRKMMKDPYGIGRFHSIDEAGGSVGPSVNNLVKALMGNAFSNIRRFFR